MQPRHMLSRRLGKMLCTSFGSNYVLLQIICDVFVKSYKIEYIGGLELYENVNLQFQSLHILQGIENKN
jgi:hypothetical protein